MGSTTKVVSIFCLGLSLLAPYLASSHPHGPPIDDQQAIKSATEYVQMIVENPELVEGLALDASWNTAIQATVHKRDLSYFVVSLYNPSQKKTLYMLLGSYGRFYDANFQGKFAGI